CVIAYIMGPIRGILYIRVEKFPIQRSNTVLGHHYVRICASQLVGSLFLRQQTTGIISKKP
ncbi:MAG: hypothetical protein J6O89_01910, partial [Aeriscardovia sp.]|nr:hypothetical protein [Aeriscardovia sp.]